MDASVARKISADILENEYHGCLDTFNYAHVPVQTLWDEHLIDGKDRGIKTLVLPCAACLSDEQISSIRHFVENGGSLIATFETGFYDEWGNKKSRPEWLNFMGIDQVEGAFSPSQIEDYWTINTDTIPGMKNKQMLPRPLNALKIKPVTDAKILAFYNNPVGKVYTLPKGISDYPGIISCKRGKGQVFYLASPIFESFNLYHIDIHKNIIHGLMQLATKNNIQVETNAPGSLAVEVRRQKGRLLIHLLNVSSDMKRPMGDIIPLFDIKISLNEQDAQNAYCTYSGKKLKLNHNNGRMEMTVPRIDAYELIVIVSKKKKSGSKLCHTKEQ